MIEEYDLILADRLGVIRAAYQKFDLENKSYISFSGGKDSLIVSKLFDMAIPGNKIPRLFIDTGIEYLAIKKFVFALQKNDPRISILRPAGSIKSILETYGYPFKSKEHSAKLHEWQKGHKNQKSLKKYLTEKGKFSCPDILRYQFEDSFKLKVSPACCKKMKKQPAKKWARENLRPIAITGIRKEEGGEPPKPPGMLGL